MAGIIKPFKDIQEIGGIEDMNDMPEGIRYIYASPYQQIANRPEDSYGHLLTYMDAEGRTTQIYYAAERRVYMRSNLGGWNAWQRIDNFGYNSLEELAGGVAELAGDVTIKGYRIENDVEYQIREASSEPCIIILRESNMIGYSFIGIYADTVFSKLGGLGSDTDSGASLSCYLKDRAVYVKMKGAVGTGIVNVRIIGLAKH